MYPSEYFPSAFRITISSVLKGPSARLNSLVAGVGPAAVGRKGAVGEERRIADDGLGIVGVEALV